MVAGLGEDAGVITRRLRLAEKFLKEASVEMSSADDGQFTREELRDLYRVAQWISWWASWFEKISGLSEQKKY